MDIHAILSYGESALTILGALVAFCTVVVSVTPTKRDDEILAKIVAVLDYFSIRNPNHVTVVPKPSPGSSSGA